MSKILVSIVVSVYNEEESLPVFYVELIKELTKESINYEIIFVNDCSTDNSYNILISFAEENENVRVLNFSRNFGHESAMLAGIDYSNSDTIICMDSDLQHPPNMIAKMLNEYKKGYDIVNMVRSDRKDGGIQKNLFSKLFYKLLNKITKIQLEPNASDFFLISKRVANILKTDYREQTRFLRGIIQFVGFPKTKLEFVAPERIAGESKYNFFELIIFSLSAISSLSKAPLRIGILTGFIFAAFGIIVGLYSLIMKIINHPIPGYTTIVILISAMFSIHFFILGIIGDYIGYIFDEVKKRPHYIIMDDSKNNEDEFDKEK